VDKQLGSLGVSYDRDTDTLVGTPREVPIEKSDDVRFGVLRASRVVEDAERVQFATAG
jgi:hypothetical protein